MEKFRKKLKTRKVVLQTYCGLIVVLIVCLNIFIPHEESFQIGFTLGAAVGTEILALIYMAKCNKALNDENLCKQLYIQEHDERQRYIQLQIGGTGLNIIIGSLLVATIISGFFNSIVFISLLSALLFSVLVKASLKFYFRSKM